MKRVGLAAVLTLLATPVLAQDLTAAPWVKAEATSGSSAQVSATIDIAAPTSVVFATLKDCAHAHEFMPKLVSCRIMETGPGGGWEIREHKLNAGALRGVMRNVFRIEFDTNRRIEFHRVDGDWKVSEGVWTMSPIPGGTHLAYTTRAAVNGPVPVSMMRSAIAKGMPEALLAIRKECVARAKRIPGK
jgi:hypothetical protein